MQVDLQDVEAAAIAGPAEPIWLYQPPSNPFISLTVNPRIAPPEPGTYEFAIRERSLSSGADGEFDPEDEGAAATDDLYTDRMQDS